MKTFYINSCDLEKWIFQNKAVVLDCLEGCLLDNLLLECKRGYAAIYEHYLNSNSSNYLVIFSNSYAALENDFYKLV